MKNIKIQTLLFMVIASLLGCKKDVDYGGTSVQKMSGDWYVTINDGTDYFEIYTFNTSDNDPNLFWIQATSLRTGEEGETNIGVKGKSSVSLSDQSFSGTNIENIYTRSEISEFAIANGKVITNGTVGPSSKTPTDSIAFDLIIDGTTYKIGGYHKTGFIEDRQ
nr:lipid-binding protein [Pedobacter panaciterrae]